MKFVRRGIVSDYINNSRNSGSVHEYLERSFSTPADKENPRRIRLAASIATVLCLIVALTLELYLAATLLAPVINADTTAVFVTVTTLMCLYSALGGFYAVVMTDVIQGILIVIGVILLIVFPFLLKLPLAPYTDIHPFDLNGFFYAPGWVGIVSIIGVTAGWYLVTMDTWQRACSSRSADTSASGMKIGTALLLLGILILGLFGIYDHLAISHSEIAKKGFSEGYNPIADLYLFKDYLSSYGQAMIGVVAIAFLAAGLSTANTFMIVCTHSIISDLMIGAGRHVSLGELRPQESRLFTGIARSLVVAMAGLIIGMYFLLKVAGLLVNPLELFYLAYSIQFALLAPVVASLWKKKPPAAAVLISLVAGIIVSVAWGFGFALAGVAGATWFLGFTIDQLVYLAPLPPIVVGFAILGLARR